MHQNLTSLFASLPAQPPVDRPAVRAAARERAMPAPPGQDQGRPHEFKLPSEPRERARAPERPRQRSDEPRARETAPRRDDPPRRSDPPRGEGRTQDGEPPHRHDAPSVRGADEPPRRTDAPGAKHDEAGSGKAQAASEAADVTASDPTAPTPAGQAGAVPAVIPETLLTIEVPAPTVASSEAALGGASDPEEAPSVGETGLHKACDSGGAAIADSAASTTEDATTDIVEGSASNPEEEVPSADESEDSAAEEAATLDSGALPVNVAPQAEQVQPTASAEQASASGAAGQAQAAGSPEQASAMAAATGAAAAVPATATGQAATAAEVPSVAIQGVEAAGAKETSAQEKHLSLHERAEILKARAETAKGALGEAAAHEAGGAAKTSAKADQALPTAFEATVSDSQGSSLAGPGASGSATASPSAPAAQASATPNVPLRVVAEVPLGAVPVEIGLKSLAGVNHFEIRLDPAELGRIEVRLEIDEDGGVKAHLTVDRVETLALLQRDARSLERAFEQAGLKPTDGSVDLTLRDGQGQGRQEQSGEQRRDGSRGPDSRLEDAEPLRNEAPPRRLWRGAAGVDVRI
jgi:flagellar hook-length control protein FliK